jgi:integrase
VPAETRGSVFRTRDGWGIRWPEAGKRPQKTGFRTRTEARQWFRENVAPRLRAAGPDPSITFDAFCDVFLARHGATVSPATRRTLAARLKPARATFGAWTLGELEYAAADVAKWRATLPESSRYQLTSALRQTLGAAVRWQYLGRNPAVDAGRNPQPRSEELLPFSAEEVEALAAETGLRTNEWVGLERRDVDKAGRAVVVQRRYADGELTPSPKTVRSRRRVPLTLRAEEAVEAIPPRLDTPILFPAPGGGYIDLHNWQRRDWYPALEAAGIARRGPYHLRHTFATEALAAGLSIFELARLMGTSVAMIDERYGHLARDSEQAIRPRLETRASGS